MIPSSFFFFSLLLSFFSIKLFFFLIYSNWKSCPRNLTMLTPSPKKSFHDFNPKSYRHRRNLIVWSHHISSQIVNTISSLIKFDNVNFFDDFPWGGVDGNVLAYRWWRWWVYSEVRFQSIATNDKGEGFWIYTKTKL